MNIADTLYGNFEVEGVFQEIVLSAPFQRLKEVHQGGALYLVNPLLNHTRFDHSLGVYWLVTRFGGNLRERAAAMLHDLSHTAFSHVIDAVFDHKEVDFHETIFQEVLSSSTIPSILAKYNLNDILNSFDNYTLLEQPLPEICADRLDYTLRDLYHADMINSNEVKNFLNDLAVKDGKFVISTVASAKWFSQQYKRLNEDYFKKQEHLFANKQLAGIIRKAIIDGNLSKIELMSTDAEVIRKLNSSGYEDELTALKNLEGFDTFDFRKAAQNLKVRIMT
ncbi:HD domain-containing protein [Pedobacter jejuensis]|uniref:HD domain-containing protein n=2 Tax=Pedobacter jejuensis TaxID=1268550 RepID=A0A3N0BQB0_9SPHI|nr:HD domain-containing protein [Pedobacter jejuensis]